METKEKIMFMDKALSKLNQVNIGLVPQLIDGHNNIPTSNSDLDRKYRIVEDELIRFGLVEQIRGGDNTTIGGYKELKIKAKGMEHVISEKSVSELYENEKSEQSIDQKTKQLTLEKLEYEQTIRDQEQRIRDLNEALKAVSLIKKYWWVILTSISIGVGAHKIVAMYF